MKTYYRVFSICVVFGILLLLPFSALAVSSYTDSISGTSFTIPDGWTEAPLSQDRDFIQVKYMPDDGSFETILFGSADAWGQLPEYEKVGIKREEYNISLFSTQDIAELFDVKALDVKTVQLGSVNYYRIDVTSEQSASGITVNVTQNIYTTIQNGYVIQFQYAYTSDETNRSDFEEAVRSATIPHSVSSSYKTPTAPPVNQDQSLTTDDITTTGNGSFGYQVDIGNLILSIIITVLVYSVPIMVYRYGIRKKPVEPRTAKIITIIYAFIAVFVMAAILDARGMGAPGGAIVLWSYINYSMLTKGGNKYDYSVIQTSADSLDSTDSEAIEKDAKEEHSSPIASDNETENTMISETNLQSVETDIDANSSKKIESVLYCHKCGAKLVEGSLFCNKCGTKVWAGDEE